MNTSRRSVAGRRARRCTAAAVGLPTATPPSAASWQQKLGPLRERRRLSAFETIEDDRADSHSAGQPHIYATGNNWRFDMHTVDRDTSTDRQRQEVTGLRNGSGSNYLSGRRARPGGSPTRCTSRAP